MRKTIYSFMLNALLLACSEDNVGDDEIKVVSGQTEQLVYADEKTNEGFTFETKGAWYATVSELSRANEVDWVTLSQTSGDAAGEYTIYITLGLNHTGVDRKAQIKIVCGETNITILVEQKGTTASGAVVKLLSQVAYESDAPYGGYEDWTETNFKYDQQGRVVQVERKIEGYDSPFTLRLDYTIVDEIAMTESDEYTDVANRYVVSLNPNGTAASVATTGDEGASLSYVYDAAGLLSKINGSDGDGYDHEDEWRAFIYEKNCIIGSEYKSSDDSSRITYSYEELYPNGYSNNMMNIDPNAFFLFDEETELLYALRFLGNTGKDCLLENRGVQEKMYAMASRVPIYTEPNVTLEKSDTSIDFLDTDGKIYYTFDSVGYVKTACCYEPYVVTTTTYTVTVSNELVEPESPDLGYKYTTSGHRTSEVRHEGLHKYTFTYK